MKRRNFIKTLVGGALIAPIAVKAFNPEMIAAPAQYPQDRITATEVIESQKDQVLGLTWRTATKAQLQDELDSYIAKKNTKRKPPKFFL